VFRRLAENTVDGAIHQICMGWRHMWEMLVAGRKVYGELKNLCVWNKANCTVHASLLGIPAISLPVLQEDGLPLGLQIASFVNGDAQAFAIAAAIKPLF